MSTATDALVVKLDLCSKHPELKSELTALIELANDEIEEGGSEEHEWELCISAMRDLANETQT